ERYRSLSDLVPAVVWTARPDGWIDYVNQFWTGYTGLRLEQTCGWEWIDAVHADDLPRVLAAWRGALQSGEQADVEYRVRRGSDGVYRWFLARGLPVRDLEGRVVKWFGTLTDIDDQKRAEAELHQQHGLARLLHEVTVAGYRAATVEEAMQIGVDQVCAYTGWPVGHVYLLAGEGPPELVPSAIRHLDRPHDSGIFRRATEATRLAPGVGLPGRVLAAEKTHWITDITTHEHIP